MIFTLIGLEFIQSENFLYKALAHKAIIINPIIPIIKGTIRDAHSRLEKSLPGKSFSNLACLAISIINPIISKIKASMDKPGIYKHKILPKLFTALEPRHLPIIFIINIIKKKRRHKHKRTNDIIYKASAPFLTKSISNIPQSKNPKVTIFAAIPMNEMQTGFIFLKQQKHDSTPIFN